MLGKAIKTNLILTILFLSSCAGSNIVSYNNDSDYIPEIKLLLGTNPNFCDVFISVDFISGVYPFALMEVREASNQIPTCSTGSLVVSETSFTVDPYIISTQSNMLGISWGVIACVYDANSNLIASSSDIVAIPGAGICP